MNERKKVSRRDFLRDSVAGAGLATLAGGVIGASVLRAQAEETPATPPPAPLPEMPKVKHRRLGRTKIEISEISAGADGLGDFLLFARAWEAGVNYYHKANALFGNPRVKEVLLKNRERIYLDVVIDNLDEQKAYDEFEAKRNQMGTEYVDFYKVHSTWGTVEDFKTKRGPLQAYDRLKKEKKARWLALSKHGGNTGDVLVAAMESGLFDAIQFPVPGQPELERILKVAQDKDVGVILMKTAGGANAKRPELAKFGDPAKPFQTWYRYLLSQPGVTSLVSMMKNVDQMRENLGASGLPMPKSELDGLTRALAQAPANYRDCIACGRCHDSCPEGLAVADIMRYRMYAEDHRDWGMARALYEQLPAAWKSIAATGEGISDAACPYGLPLAAELKRAHRWLA